MTAKDVADKLARPKAEQLPPRSYESWNRDWIWHMAAIAQTPELGKYWRDRFVAEGGRPDALP